MRRVEQAIPPLPHPLTPASAARWLNAYAGWEKWSEDQAAVLLSVLEPVHEDVSAHLRSGGTILRKRTSPG